MGGPFPFTSYDCSCNVLYDASGLAPCCNNCGRCQCTGAPCLFTPGMRAITQKRIQKQVRVDASQYTSVLSAKTIQGGKNNLPLNLPNKGFYNVNQSQASDRNKLGVETRYVPGPGHKSSTRSSVTRLRPGSMGAKGYNAVGVDVKHNSYDRYLGRLKAKSLGASWKNGDNPNVALPFTTLPGAPPYYKPDQMLKFDRFSKINYSILGDGLCNICIK